MLRRVQIGGPHHGRHILSIRERLQRLIPDINRVLNRPLPVRVFVHYRRQYLAQMVAVRVPHESPQDLGPPVRLDAVLDVVAAEGEVGLGADYAQHQVVSGQLRDDGLPKEHVVEDVDGVGHLLFRRLALELVEVVRIDWKSKMKVARLMTERPWKGKYVFIMGIPAGRNLVRCPLIKC